MCKKLQMMMHKVGGVIDHGAMDNSVKGGSFDDRELE